MKYYHCMENECESTFEADRAKFCPCCGSRMIRHALGREIDAMKREPEREVEIIPIYAIGA